MLTVTKQQSKQAIRAEHLRFVQAAIEIAGPTPTDLARNAALSPSTITRFLSDDYLGTLTALTIDQICKATGLPPPGEPAGDLRPALATLRGRPRGLAEEGARYDPSGSDPRDALIRRMTEENPNCWAFTIKTAALALAGVRPGDICLFDARLPPRPGDVVVAQIEQAGGATTVFRLWQPPNLIAAGFDPTAWRPEPVDGERVRIVAVMVELLRRRAL